MRTLIVLVAILCTLPAYAGAQRKPKPKATPGEVVVMLEPGVVDLASGETRSDTKRANIQNDVLRQLLDKRKAKALRKALKRWVRPTNAKVEPLRKGKRIAPDALVDLSHLYVIEFDTTADVAALAQELNALEGVVFAEPNYTISLMGVDERPVVHRSHLSPFLPNDPYFQNGSNWGFYNPSNRDVDVHAPEAWAIQTGSESIRIAILDSGIDKSHGDFGNGTKVVGEYDFVNDDANAYPDLNWPSPGHGTAVAGIAAGETNDGAGSAGMCGGNGSTRGCSILAAKIIGESNRWDDFVHWLTNTSDASDAVNWAISNGARVLNNSWCASSEVIATHAAMRNAYLQGALVVAASGNNEQDPDDPNSYECDQAHPTDC